MSFEAMLSSVVLVILGAAIQYFATARSDNRKWEREQKQKQLEWQREEQQKYAEEQRAAYSQALKWIAPLTQDVINAGFISRSRKLGRLNSDDFYEQYPHPVLKLKELELEEHQRAVLPPAVYDKASEIVFGFDDIEDIANDDEQDIAALDAQITKLETNLHNYYEWIHDEYRKTFYPTPKVGDDTS